MGKFCVSSLCRFWNLEWISREAWRHDLKDMKYDRREMESLITIAIVQGDRLRCWWVLQGTYSVTVTLVYLSSRTHYELVPSLCHIPSRNFLKIFQVLKIREVVGGVVVKPGAETWNKSKTLSSNSNFKSRQNNPSRITFVRYLAQNCAISPLFQHYRHLMVQERRNPTLHS